MLLHDARRAARINAAGELVPLEDQDRSRWDASQITEGVALLEAALRLGRPGPYQLQAAIVLNYDRRGRGDSGDTPPYAVEREIEDLHAVVTEAGGAAAGVFGNSSGAVLALHAAAAGLPITKLALWEPPFMTDPDAPRRQQAYLAQLTGLLDAGRRGDAMALFMRSIGLPERWRPRSGVNG
jgi:predicted RNA polymerase sigma factor